ncbi:Peptidase_S10 domain-containing protein [Cephalotus follicularis]|uniref:Peptidase_S10 domain-containing protein n=1 Tax=Cephalotus follicularis TaxID=3775 RepID=A0A1Q3CF18_CEPFO|nr:Peptidase_S10 domain-containing protein [Cephalotus follicularis]
MSHLNIYGHMGLTLHQVYPSSKKVAMATNSSKCLQLLLLLLLSVSVFSGQIVKTLPGYTGDLPFTLETGYTTVGDVEFFYYFVQSESNPAADPLLVYFNGGPGCSGLNGFFYQIGPLKFDTTNYTGGLPTLLYEPSAWSKTANIIFLDSPVGSGFTYATTDEGWNTTDTKSAQQAHGFIRHWLADHPDFQTNPVYLGSDSYAGLTIPMLARNILDGNTAGLEPTVNLKGLSLGCPHTDTIFETNAKIPFAHRLALVSDSMYEAALVSCNGTYANVDAKSTDCIEAVNAITECVELISRQNVLEPDCSFLSPKESEQKARRILRQNPGSALLQSPRIRDLYCHNFPYLLSPIWGNYRIVQEALHVRQGTIQEFVRCNISLSYTVDTNSVLMIHQNLTNEGLQLLVFSGDHDMVIPHNGIEDWIASLDLSLDIDWRPWFTNGQVAGYTRRFTNSGYRLTYATIKGAGHSPQEYERKKCFQMFHRWINYYPI